MSDPYGQPASGQSPPGPDAVSSDDKAWALAAHIGTLVAAYIALGFLAPLIIMVAKKDSPYVRRHAVESLNFQISLLIYFLIGTVVMFVVALLTFGIGLFVLVPVALVLGLVALVLIIIATIKASNGEEYRYPLTIRFVN